MNSDRAQNGLQVVASNAAALLTSDVLNKATTFLMYAMVARYLGTHEFGQLALALLLFHTFQVLATAGLPTLMTRSVAKRPNSTGRLFVNGMIAGTLASGLAVAGLALLTLLMQYEADTTRVILTLSLGLIPFGLSMVIEAVLRGREQMHLIAWANVPSNIAKVTGAWALLEMGADVIALALLVVGVRLAVLLIEWGLLIRFVDGIKGRVSQRLVRA